MPGGAVKSSNTEEYLRGRTTTPRTGRTTTPSFKPTYAINPAQVLLNRSLSFRAKCVYQVMAYFRKGAYVSVGERRLAGAAGIDRRSLRSDIAKLIECGHIERAVPHPGERARYFLADLPAIFESAAGKNEDAEAVADAFTRPLVTCPKCKKPCGGILKVGWCRRCNRKVELRDEMRQVVQEEMAAAKIA
jgi:hypothetical protein